MATLPKLIDRINTISFKIPGAFFAEIEADPTIHTEMQGALNSQTCFKENKVGGLTLPGFKIYYKATVNQGRMVLA